MELYHASKEIVQYPEVRKARYTKDFSWGFYCTKSFEQAYRWAERRHEQGIVNVYTYVENEKLNIKNTGICFWHFRFRLELMRSLLLDKNDFLRGLESA